MSTLTASNARLDAHLPTISPTDRRAKGKRLRDGVLRGAHDEWRAPSDRADPICILRAADLTRQQDLVPLGYGRMLLSPFSFYRGSAGVMAADRVGRQKPRISGCYLPLSCLEESAVPTGSGGSAGPGGGSHPGT